MLLDFAERALNRWIGESTPARQTLTTLEGKSLAVQFAGTDQRWLLDVDNDRVSISSSTDRKASVELSGSPLDLLGLLGNTTTAGLKRSGVEVSGELHVAEAFAEMLRLARPDLEEELAGWVGDVPAHAVGQAFSSFRRFAQRAHQGLQMSVSEYLREEIRLLPDETQCNALSRDIETLRDDVDRCAARLQKIEAKLAR